MEVSQSGRVMCSRSIITSDMPGGMSNNSRGIKNAGVITLRDCTVSGVYAGVYNTGDLYVRGGTYNGYMVGGFELSHAEDKIAYIKDCLVRCNHYDDNGSFAGQVSATPLYSTWIVNGNKTSVYFDNCQFGDDTDETYPSMVI